MSPEQLAAELAHAAATIEERAGGHVHSVARDVANAASAMAPRVTGALAASITADKEGVATAEVGSDLRYAGFVEYGTWKDAPQPYLGPAAEASAPELAERIAEEGARI